MEKLTLVITVTAIITVASSLPTPKHEFKHMSVDKVQGNRTVCPFKVEITDNADRIPRRIKIIKCVHPDATTQVKTHHHKHRCEDMKTNENRGQCVELHDQVYVKYKSTGRMAIYNAPVGCSCMFLNHDSLDSPENLIE